LIKMKSIMVLGITIIMLFASIGLGAATCSEGCDYTASSTPAIVEGSTVTLTGPLHSPDGRDLTWYWTVTTCTGTILQNNIYLTARNLQTVQFIAPPAGDYKVVLTVKDAAPSFAETCKDTKTLCFTTTPSTCPTLACGYVCELDSFATAPNALPWYMSYGGLSSNYIFEWTVAGHSYKIGTDKWVKINWVASSFVDAVDGGTVNLGVGCYSVGFKIYRPAYSAAEEEAVDEGEIPGICWSNQCWVLVKTCEDNGYCTCASGNVPTLTPCHVCVIDAPTATIMGIPPYVDD
jgi:hypothetical protein